MREASNKAKVIQQAEDFKVLNCVVKEVCNYFGISETMMQSKHRYHEIRTPRQIAHYFTRELTKVLSWAAIGYNIGKKDHATAMHSHKIIKNYIDTDRKFRTEITQLELIINSIIGINYDSIAQY